MTQYRDLLDSIADEFEAEAVVLVILGGTRGSGVAIKIGAPSTAEAFARVPELVDALYATADQLAADAKAEQRSKGN